MEGNALTDACVEMVHACLKHGVGFSVENPKTSMMWLYPPMLRIAQRPDVYTVDLVYCRFGMKWMKQTRILTNIPALKKLACKCAGDHQHQILRGTAQAGHSGRDLLAHIRLCCAKPSLALCVLLWKRGI